MNSADKNYKIKRIDSSYKNSSFSYTRNAPWSSYKKEKNVFGLNNSSIYFSPSVEVKRGSRTHTRTFEKPKSLLSLSPRIHISKEKAPNKKEFMLVPIAQNAVTTIGKLIKDIKVTSVFNISQLLSLVLVSFAITSIDKIFSFSFLNVIPENLNLTVKDKSLYSEEDLKNKDFESDSAMVLTLAPPLEISHVRYTVKDGENYSSIAHKNNITLGTILSYNGIKDDPVLQPGQIINIPNQNGISYTVKKGDSIESIAQEYGISPFAIYDVNNLESDKLEVNMVLFLPGAIMNQEEYAKAAGLESSEFLFPVDAWRVTSTFGWRENPFTKSGKEYHSGLDLANPRGGSGHPIKASRSGVVVETIWGNSTYGNYITIDHGEGYKTRYGHLKDIKVKNGQYVTQGSVIGIMGSTGRSTGPHVHFEIRINNNPVNPWKFLKK